MRSVAYAFLTLLLLATPFALAQVAAEPSERTITADIIRANIRVSTLRKFVLTVAVLVLRTKRAYELATGLPVSRKTSQAECVVAGSLAPRQLVSLPSKLLERPHLSN